jgi:hypothetical protein
MSDPREYPQEIPAARSALFPVSNPPADRPRSDPQIEDYLDQIYAPLVGWVPYASRTELRAELQAHLESLVAAYQELGSSPDTAVRAALAQSGDPQAMAREWVREWERILPRRKAPPAWYATLVALGCFAVAARLFFGLIVAAQAGAPVPMWLGYAVSVLLPLLAGLTTGVLSRARSVQAVLAALVLLFPLFPPMAMALANSTGTDWDFNQVAGMALVQGIVWIPIGCASAAFGGWLRTRREQAPKRWVLPA